MKHFIALTAVAALAFGCGAKKEDEENNKNLQDGTWVEACRQHGGSGSSSFRLLNLLQDTGTGDTGGDMGGDSSPEYSKMTLKFDGSTFTAESSNYSDANCTTQTMGMKLEGTYKSGDDAAKPGTAVEGATAIDISVTSAMVKFTTAEYVAAAATMCTPAPTINTYVDSATCNFGENGGGGPKKGEVWYMIFKASETELFWGNDETGDGKTAATRPTALETKAMTKG